MMNSKREKFLTEAMGECWHEVIHALCAHVCPLCEKLINSPEQGPAHTDFATWDGFGKLGPFVFKKMGRSKTMEFVENCLPFDKGFPNRFADVVCAFLKERK